jgi:YVTN family beta-propeller protein
LTNTIDTISLDVSYPHHISVSPDGALLAIAVPGMDLSGGHLMEPQGGAESDGSIRAHDSLQHSGHSILQHGMAGKVLVVSVAGRAVTQSRDLPAMNHNAAFSLDGTEIWTSQMTDPGKVLILDAASLETKAEIAVGRHPAEVTFSSDGRRAFVANIEDDSITAIDVSTRAILSTIPVAGGPVGAWPGADGLMYIDSERGKSISALDPVALALVRTYDLGFTPGMAATDLEHALWVTDSDNGKVAIFAANTTTLESQIATDDGAHGIAFTADGTRAFVTNQTSDTVSVIDTTSRTVISTLSVGKKPNGIVFGSK